MIVDRIARLAGIALCAGATGAAAHGGHGVPGAHLHLGGVALTGTTLLVLAACGALAAWRVGRSDLVARRAQRGRNRLRG